MKLFVFSGFFLGIAMQLHYLSTFLAAILFFYILISGLLINRKKFLLDTIKKFFLIGIGFILGISPFLLFEIKNGFPNSRTIINFIFSSGEVSGDGNSIEIVGDVFFRVFGRLVTYYPENINNNPIIDITVWFYGTLLLAIAVLGFSIFTLYKKIRSNDKNAQKFLLLPLWLIMGVLLFGLYKKGIYDYYFGFMFPVPFLLVGIFLSYLWSKGKIFMVVSIILFSGLFLLNISGQPFQHEPNRQYNQVRTISEFVLDKAEGKPFNFALITGGNSDHAYRYIFEVEGNPPIPIEFPGVDPERKTITDQLLIVCESDCQPLGHSLWEVAGFGRAEIEGEWDVSVVKVYKLVHYEEQD